MFPNPWILLAAVLAFAGAAFGGMIYGQHVQFTADQLAVERQNAEAAAKLANLTQHTRQVEQAHDAIKDELEQTNANHQKAIDDLMARNRADIERLGGLYDARGSGPRGRSAVPGLSQPAASDHGAPTGCQLSIAASNDLLDLATDADRIAAQLKTAQDWITQVQSNL